MAGLLLFPKRHSRTLKLWLFGLSLSWLMSIGISQVHAVKHAGPVSNQHAVSEHQDEHPHDFFDQLFSNHSSGTDCRLYDQLSGGDTLPLAAALTLLVCPPPLAVAIFQGEALARWVALFDARGPPLTF